MRIDGPLLGNFVRKASLDGEIQFLSLNFKDEGLHTRVKDIIGIAITDTFVPREKFEDYEAIGEVLVRDSGKLKKYLDTFAAYVDLEVVDGSILKLSDMSREVHVVLGSPEVIENIYKKDLPELEHEVNLSVTKDEMSRTVRDVSLSSEDAIKFKCKDGDLSLQLGKTNRGLGDIIINNVSVSGKGTGTVNIGKLFISFYNVVDNEFDVKYSTDSPIELVQTSEGDIDFSCIIAPIVQTD